MNELNVLEHVDYSTNWSVLFSLCMYSTCTCEYIRICLISFTTLQKNTFQAVLATNGVESYVIFLYDQLEWASTASDELTSTALPQVLEGREGGREGVRGREGGREREGESEICTYVYMHFKIIHTYLQVGFSDANGTAYSLLPGTAATGSFDITNYYLGPSKHVNITLRSVFIHKRRITCTCNTFLYKILLHTCTCTQSLRQSNYA